MRAGRPFSSSFCISRRMNRKNGLVGHHEGGTTVTPFSHFFLYRDYVMWRQPRSSVGSNFPAAAIMASFFRNRFVWYSALPVGMFYAQRADAGKIDFPIDTIF